VEWLLMLGHHCRSMSRIFFGVEGAYGVAVEMPHEDSI
jgi:hypothetical protein